MASKEDEQLDLLVGEYPQESREKLQYLLQRFQGNLHQVRSTLTQRAYHNHHSDWLESQFGPAVTILQEENSFAQTMKRTRLLRMIEQSRGDLDRTRQALEKLQFEWNLSNMSRDERREQFKRQFASQLALVGLNVNSPFVLDQLEKYQGDVNKVIDIMQRRQAKKDQLHSLTEKYTDEIELLKSRGIDVKNKPMLIQLLDKTHGQVDEVEKLLQEKQQKRETNHRPMDSLSTETYEVTTDDWDHLRQLRAAGIHGNPMKILSLFHQCHRSIELTRTRLEESRSQRDRQQENRVEKRIALVQIHDGYLNLIHRDDWPRDVEQIYFDGNNMMFMIDTLRRLCLDGQRQRAECALGMMVAAWNETMHLSHVELIFDSTTQLDSIGTVQITSAQPNYPTTDALLIAKVRQTEHIKRNPQTIIVTSDRALAILLKREDCLLLKPYNWFAHCVMIVTPDLLPSADTETDFSQPKSVKNQYNFDELVHRLARLELD